MRLYGVSHCPKGSTLPEGYQITNVVSITFIIALTFSVAVASSAFNIEKKNGWWRNMLFVCALAAGQGLMYWLGALLGGTFMYKFAGFAKVIVLVFCFMIAFRMVLDTLKIKTGKNLFLIDKPKQLLFLSIALGINALIAGLIAGEQFLPLFGIITPLYIIGISLIWGLIGIGTKLTQTKLLINSLLNIAAALTILAIGIIAIV